MHFIATLPPYQTWLTNSLVEKISAPLTFVSPRVPGFCANSRCPMNAHWDEWVLYKNPGKTTCKKQLQTWPAAHSGICLLRGRGVTQGFLAGARQPWLVSSSSASSAVQLSEKYSWILRKCNHFLKMFPLVWLTLLFVSEKLGHLLLIFKIKTVSVSCYCYKKWPQSFWQKIAQILWLWQFPR